MLSPDAARVTAGRLGALGVPVLVSPNLYGAPGVRDVDWYALNHPRGWAVVLRPLPLGTQDFFSLWSVAVEAVARNEPAARALAAEIQRALLHTARTPTGYAFMGDSSAGTSGTVFKYVLTFTALLRQGE